MISVGHPPTLFVRALVHATLPSRVHRPQRACRANVLVCQGHYPAALAQPGTAGLLAGQGSSLMALDQFRPSRSWKVMCSNSLG
jgi:hypothetical protein